jgi:hypothetical protein
MKYIKIALGLALAAGSMAVAASPALALSPRWVTCLFLGEGHGQWEDSHCTDPKTGGGWETREVRETREVTSSSSSIELEDSDTLLGASSVKCEWTNEGTIGTNGQDSVRTITVVKCEKVKEGGCETLESVKPVNLPWSTLLEEREGPKGGKEVRDRITSLIAGKNPGWAVKCDTALGPKTDECTGINSTKIENGPDNLYVVATFDKVSEETPAECTESQATGKKSGFVRGATISKLRNARGELQALWVLAAAFKT